MAKELEIYNKRRRILKQGIFTDRHISLMLFDMKHNKNVDLYEIEEAFKGKKSLLKRLKDKAEKQGTTINEIISEYDNINIEDKITYTYEKWTGL